MENLKAMDPKEMRSEVTLGECMSNGNSNFPQSTSTATQTGDKNKTYHDIGSNSLGRGIMSGRPCAVIEPDRAAAVAPQLASAEYHKREHLQHWPLRDATFQQAQFYPQKPSSLPNPPRNISPRQTFQENMQRIMVPPTYNNINGDHNFLLEKSDTVPKIVKATETQKFCDVPFSVNHINSEQKLVNSCDMPLSNVNSTYIHPQNHVWPQGVVTNHSQPHFASPDLYQYNDYPSCAVPPNIPYVRPQRVAAEDPMQTYAEHYYRGRNIRFEPYPTAKERLPPPRYDYVNRFPTSYQPPQFSSQKIDLQKLPPTYPAHLHGPYARESAIESFQRNTKQQLNYNVPFHGQGFPPKYNAVPGNTLPSKYYPYSDFNLPSPTSTQPNYDQRNKLYVDYKGMPPKAFPPSQNFYMNEYPRHMIKGQTLPNYSSNVHPLAYYRKDAMPPKTTEFLPSFKQTDSIYYNSSSRQYPLNIPACEPSVTQQPFRRLPDESGFSPQAPAGRNINLPPHPMYHNYDYQYGHPLNSNQMASKIDPKSKPISKEEKKNLDVRQFITTWSEVDEEGNENANNGKEIIIQTSGNFSKQCENLNHQEQLYVLGLVNVPSEELSKYEHIQKVSKLPDNIKGYTNIELLNQFEEVIESSKVQNRLPPVLENNVKRASIVPRSDIPRRPVSPFDVEAKISQSVIHKDVGCNFEIRPCSPGIVSVQVAAPAQPLSGERTIEKVNNPINKEPTTSPSSEQNALQKSNINSLKISEQHNISSCDVSQSKSQGSEVNLSYSLQDLESNSGVCLASLPRLDNDIELNFPEVNQQFINANKPECADLQPPYILELGENQSDTCQSKDPSKLIKYRKSKNGDNETNLVPIRTDSVIKNNIMVNEIATSPFSTNDESTMPDTNLAKTKTHLTSDANTDVLNLTVSSLLQSTSDLENADVLKTKLPSENTFNNSETELPNYLLYSNESPINSLLEDNSNETSSKCEDDILESTVGNDSHETSSKAVSDIFKSSEDSASSKSATECVSDILTPAENTNKVIKSNKNIKHVQSNDGIIGEQYPDAVQHDEIPETNDSIREYIENSSKINLDNHSNRTLDNKDRNDDKANTVDTRETDLCKDLNTCTDLSNTSIIPEPEIKNEVAVNADDDSKHNSSLPEFTEVPTSSIHSEVNKEMPRCDVQQEQLTNIAERNFCREIKLIAIEDKLLDEEQFNIIEENNKTIQEPAVNLSEENVLVKGVVASKISFKSFWCKTSFSWVIQNLLFNPNNYFVDAKKQQMKIISDCEDLSQSEIYPEIISDSCSTSTSDTEHNNKIPNKITEIKDTTTDNIYSKTDDQTKQENIGETAGLLAVDKVCKIEAKDDSPEDFIIIDDETSSLKDKTIDVNLNKADNCEPDNGITNDPEHCEELAETVSENLFQPRLNVNHGRILSLDKPLSPKPRCRSLKRSLSESAICLGVHKNDEFQTEPPSLDKTTFHQKKRKRKSEDGETHIILDKNLSNIFNINRRNSISTLCEENVSFCIMIDDNCIVAQENVFEGGTICFANIDETSFENNRNEPSVSLAQHSPLDSENNEDVVFETEDICYESCADENVETNWVDDIARVETVVSDETEHDDVSPASPGYVHTLGKKIELANIELTINEHSETERILNDESVSLSSALSPNQRNYEMTEDKILLLSDNIVAKRNCIEELISSDSSLQEFDRNLIETGDSFDIFKEDVSCLIEDMTKEHLRKNNYTSDCHLDECPREPVGITSIFGTGLIKKELQSYAATSNGKLNDEISTSSTYIRASCSPEVTSTTSDEKKTILLKITNHNGARTAEVNNTNLCSDKKIRSKFSETQDYLDTKPTLPVVRPLITKAAQKYIPPLKETIGDLKVKLRLPKDSLVKLRQLKHSKTVPTEIVIPKENKKSDSKLFKPNVISKQKPKFEDVLKSIDELQIKKSKEKTKKSKKHVPKVIIKKNENGSHYASHSNKALFNPDLTGRKWQPWVFLEKNTFIDKMALKGKQSALYCRRKKSYIFLENFRKYRSINQYNSEFIISKHNESFPSCPLKYTIRLKRQA